MVGRAVSEYCLASGDLVFPYDHAALEIADLDQVTQVLKHDAPDVVINCAAWTDVDGCELNRDRAFAANALGPENLARASREVDAGLITISTDYVFDGQKDGFYTQRDQPCPESIYGLSKLEGERRAQLANARTMVVRTGFIFGPGGTNFLSTVIERANRGEPAFDPNGRRSRILDRENQDQEYGRLCRLCGEPRKLCRRALRTRVATR